jgi:hypothetical protein
MLSANRLRRASRACVWFAMRATTPAYPHQLNDDGAIPAIPQFQPGTKGQSADGGEPRRLSPWKVGAFLSIRCGDGVGKFQQGARVRVPWPPHCAPFVEALREDAAASRGMSLIGPTPISPRNRVLVKTLRTISIEIRNSSNSFSNNKRYTHEDKPHTFSSSVLVLLTFITQAFEFIDVFLSGDTVEKAIEIHGERTHPRVRGQKDILK